ncbi:MAG: coiled-coil domain-containing protein [Raoultibacter sp.]|jgi:cell wall-associated NlpC family hydrolase
MGEQNLRLSRRTFLGGAAAFGVVSIVSSPLVAFGVPSAAEKQAEADSVRVQVNALKAELTEKSNEYGAALDAHDAALASMEEAQAQIDETSAKIADLQDHLGTRARGMYRSGSTSFLDLLLGATTFAEFSTNWDLLNRMNEDDANMVEEAKVLREDLQAARDEYAAQEKLAAAKAEEARIAKEEVENTASHYQGILDSLDAEARDLLLAEQEAAAVAAASNAVAQQQAGGDGGSSGSSGGSGGGSAADYGPPAGDLLSEASKYLGLNYVAGGTDPSVGFDCSGLVYYCCLRTGRSLPPRSTYGYGGGWFPVSEAQPGDVLWQPNHVGICASAGGGSYIHAADYQWGVCYGSSPQFQRAYRF